MPRGSKPGERRGGRVAGTPNKVTNEVAALARQHGPAALRELARLSAKAESETARVAAIREILDRAYGRVPQAHTAPEGTGLVFTIVTNVPQPGEE